jgi:mono/diheme cytochrome c family protein
MKRPLCILFAALLIGCGSPRRDEPSTAPLQASSESILAGQRVFAAYCYECHPGGAAGLAPAINNKPLPGWLMKTQVRKGLGAMPAFGEDKIDDAQLDSLIAYLQSLRKL